MVAEGLSGRETAQRLGISHTNARYRLRKAGLKTNSHKRANRLPPQTHCALCEKFLGENPKNSRLCMACRTKIRRIRTKLAGIELLDGVCARCGYEESPWAMDFHHTGNDKNFSIGSIANKGWSVVKAELLKCELLCANCHRLTHCAREDEKLLEEVANYRGSFLPLR